MQCRYKENKMRERMKVKFKDIDLLRGYGDYRISVPINHIEIQVNRWKDDMGLELEPDFQRGHVWSEAQQVNYVMFILRQGKSGRDILFNHTKWHDYKYPGDGEFVCVDGLQRLTAILRFVRNEIKVFDHYYQEYEDPMRMTSNCLTFHVNDLSSKQEVLEWYLDLNSGGTVHSAEELTKVKLLLSKEKEIVI
jgi:hypothetical protein